MQRLVCFKKNTSRRTMRNLHITKHRRLAYPEEHKMEWMGDQHQVIWGEGAAHQGKLAGSQDLIDSSIDPIPQ